MDTIFHELFCNIFQIPHLKCGMGKCDILICFKSSAVSIAQPLKMNFVLFHFGLEIIYAMRIICTSIDWSRNHYEKSLQIENWFSIELWPKILIKSWDTKIFPPVK